MNGGRAPRSGDVYLADLEPVRGSEQGRKRPVVVLQAPELARFTRTLLCVPLTSNQRRLGVLGTCFLPAGDGGLPRDSVALAFQLRALDRTRLRKRFGALPPAPFDAVSEAVLAALGVDVER